MNCDRHRLQTRMASLAMSCLVVFASSGLLAANPHSNTALESVRPGREFRLKVGRQVTVKGTKVRIRFVAVENVPRTLRVFGLGMPLSGFNLGPAGAARL